MCLTVTHFFSERGALTVTTAAFFAAHPFPKGVTASGTERYPSPGFFHQGVPSFALTHGVLATLPPHRKVLCQVPACRWREGLKCAPADQLLAARLHVLLRRPGDTLSRSSTNISRRRFAGPRNGLVGHRSWSSTNISQLLSTSHQSGIAFVVRRPTSHNCVYFTHFRLPRKKETQLQCPPTCQAPEKDHS